MNRNLLIPLAIFAVAFAFLLVGLDYGVYGVPEKYVIHKAGVIRHKHIGPVTAQSFETKIVPLIRELQKS